MRIKKFRASTVKDAMISIKKEFGEDAIILKTEKVTTTGMLDFTEKKPVYEVTAAIDKTPVNSFQKEYRKEDLSSKKDKLNNLEKKNKNNIKSSFVDSKFRNFEIKNNLKNIENKLDQIAGRIKYKNMPNMPQSLIPFYNRLKDVGVEEDLIIEIFMNINMELHGSDFENEDLIIKKIRESLSKYLNFKRITKEKIYSGPKVMAFVGPTGVGKTTTLAKMAFNNKFFGGLKVGLITADTYRIAAIDQLKTYSNITQIPLEIIYKPRQIKVALEKYKSYDIVLLDTAGRSHKNKNQLYELKQILYEGGIIDIVLVLSLPTRDSDIREVVRRFGSLNFNYVVLTKLDETNNFGTILNCSWKDDLPLAAVTYGQNVPDDIEELDKDKIIDMIFYPEKVNFE